MGREKRSDMYTTRGIIGDCLCCGDKREATPSLHNVAPPHLPPFHVLLHRSTSCSTLRYSPNIHLYTFTSKTRLFPRGKHFHNVVSFFPRTTLYKQLSKCISVYFKRVLSDILDILKPFQSVSDVMLTVGKYYDIRIARGY